jgi:hypothetical protein
MDTEALLARVADLIIEGVDAVDLAVEETTRENIVAAHGKVTEAQRGFDDAVKADPTTTEKRFGRRLTDLRRRAAQLPSLGGGRDTAKAVDAGVVPFIERRAPAGRIDSGDAVAARTRAPEGLSIGGEIEAWCGPCGGMHTHHIVAMVDDQPKAVICQACGQRHNFRTGPARGKAAAGAAAGPRPSSRGSSERRRSPEEIEAERRAKERLELRQQLAEATTVRPFSPKDRYRAGEIIEHPEYGRGKIENVLRGSLLVRFGTGLRPLDLG